MKYKWVIMKEMEDSNSAALPYKIVEDEDRAEQICCEMESKHDGFIYWTYLCEEE